MGLRENQAWVWFLVALFTAVLVFLIGPPIPDDQQAARCVINVRFRGPFGLSLACDSPEFLRLATNPTGLLEPQNARQSRPGLIFAAAFVALPLAPLRGLATRFGVHADPGDWDPHKASAGLANYPPAFVAYLLLNILFLAAAFGCLMKICGPGATPVETMIVVSAGLLLLANHTVKYVWTPHTQIFNILVPMVGVQAATQASSDGLRGRRYAAAAGAVTGLGFTAYALFAVIIPCLVLPALVCSLRLPRRELRVRIANVAIVAALSVLPYVAWFLFVRHRTGGFYSAEVTEYKLVVWMRDAWAQGATVLVTRLAEKLWLLIELAAPQAIGVAVMVVWAIAVPIFAGTRADLRPALQVIGAGLFVSALIALFYTSVGMIEARLAYATVPPMIAVAAVAGLTASKQLSPRYGWLLAAGSLAIAIVQMLVTVINSDA
jgi:hypothetical protein